MSKAVSGIGNFLFGKKPPPPPVPTSPASRADAANATPLRRRQRSTINTAFGDLGNTGVVKKQLGSGIFLG